ncbi:MAG: hypothetical protein ACD_7C00063G0003 [uncultured bacterium]|nr:MAG: hypothetical protein ACD_7C00063G0003 [uncultured bacterium]
MTGITNIKIIQKYNKELIQELGTIQSSGGWQFLKKFGKFEKAQPWSL